MTAISALALLITTLAILASARRLRAIHQALSLDPAAIVAKLREGTTLPELSIALRTSNAEPEAALVAAVLSPADQRAARTNEVLFEIDESFERWARVPRVATSVASTVGFLLASLALRRVLTMAPIDEVPPELREALLYRALHDGFDAAALGLFGALTCATIHARARTARRARMSALDQLVQELEARSPLPGADRLV